MYHFVGTVNLTEPLGDETIVFIDYGDDETLITKVESSHVARQRGLRFQARWRDSLRQWDRRANQGLNPG